MDTSDSSVPAAVVTRPADFTGAGRRNFLQGGTGEGPLGRWQSGRLSPGRVAALSTWSSLPRVLELDGRLALAAAAGAEPGANGFGCRAGGEASRGAANEYGSSSCSFFIFSFGFGFGLCGNP